MSILQTDRLLLSEASPEDSAVITNYVIRNKEFLAPWEPKREEAFFSEESQRALLEADQQVIESGGLVKLWISLQEDPDTVIGSVVLGNIVRGVFLSCNLGYRLDKGLLGKGYMPEAVQMIVKHGFDSLGLHRIEANIIPRNAASLSVVRKLGFQEEGLAKRYLKINGKWEDHIHMVMLNDALEIEEEGREG
ncbi:30S ribosomal protein S5 alanine N-acetyltransferase [Paenibacillus herberti]|uniref:30S ribosomal protein S5 alanine N-acetyltransferase n=1 Tax=Paenibacillus herberti TaxID=1619309 RepID=A0A229P635_9BACL|nr:30S ribosomal protein S5 alanine N-acetyltransferase [Paenibacillus herberti]